MIQRSPPMEAGSASCRMTCLRQTIGGRRLTRGVDRRRPTVCPPPPVLAARKKGLCHVLVLDVQIPIQAMVVNVAEKPEQDSGRHDWERRTQVNRR